MDLYSFSVLCFTVCSFFVGLLVWLKRADQVGKLFFWHSIVISLWGLGFAFMIMPSTSYDFALRIIRPSNGIAAFVPIAWFHFTLALTQNLNRRKKVLKALYFFATLTLVFSFTPWFIPKLRPIWHFAHYTTAGPLYHLLTIVYFFTVPFGFYELVIKIRVSRKEEKKQFLGLLIISFFGYLGGSLSFIPVYDIPFPQYGLFLLPIYPFGLAYVITRTNLFEIEELAQAAHRDKLMAIGVLAASINHEVRNPLYIIRELAGSWLERQKEGIFKDDKQIIEKGQDAMRRSIEQADRAMDIIKRLSLFAKSGIESELKSEHIKLASVLEDILPLIRYELAANSIALSREIPPDLPNIYADRRYLEEILFNLLVNACQAIKSNFPSENTKVNWASPGNLQVEENRCQGKGTGKGGEIKIKAEIAAPSKAGLAMTRPQSVIARSLAEGGTTWQSQGEIASPSSRLAMTNASHVIITIQDTGPGIPEEKIKDVFRPFYTTKEEGTGLGLYITQQLVEKIRGRIDVKSQLGSGTEFTVTLPVK